MTRPGFKKALALGLLIAALGACSKGSDKFVTQGSILPSGGGGPATGGSGSGSSVSGFGATVTAPASAGAIQLTVATGTTVATAQAQQVGTPVTVGPAGTTFTSPVTVVLSYDPSKVTDPSTLVVLRRNDTTNEVSILAPIAVDTANSTVTVQTTSFSTFMPASLPAKGHLQGTYTVVGHITEVSNLPDGEAGIYQASGTRSSVTFDGVGGMVFGSGVEVRARLEQRAGSPGSTGAAITSTALLAAAPTWSYDYDPKTGLISITAAGETASGARSLDGSVVVISTTRASAGSAATSLFVAVKQHSVSTALSGLSGIDTVGIRQELSTQAAVDSDAITVAYSSLSPTGYSGTSSAWSTTSTETLIARLQADSTLNTAPTADTYQASTASISSVNTNSFSLTQGVMGLVDGPNDELGAVNASGSVVVWQRSATASVGSASQNELYLAFPSRTDHAQSDFHGTWSVFGINRELSAPSAGTEARLDIYAPQGASLVFSGGTWTQSSSGEIIRRLSTTVGVADDTLAGTVSTQSSGASGTGVFSLMSNGRFTLDSDVFGLLSADNSLFVVLTQDDTSTYLGREIRIGVRRPSVPSP